MRLSIDTKETTALNIGPIELWVLQTMRVLTYERPWNGTYSALARISGINSRYIVTQAMNKLKSLGYVYDCIGGWDVNFSQKTVRNSQAAVRNSQESVSFLKRKEPKENINNNYIKCECENNIHAPAPAQRFFVNTNFTPPTWEEWRDFGNSKEIPYATFRKAWAYYTMRGWKDVADWKAALYYWDLRDRR